MLTNRNWISGSSVWTSGQETTKSISIKRQFCKSSSSAEKVDGLTLGGLPNVSMETRDTERCLNDWAEVSRGHSTSERKEGPNNEQDD